MLDDSVESVENRLPAQTTNSGPGFSQSAEAASRESQPTVGMPTRDGRRGPIQQLRIAVVLTEGVRLAVWMGGVSRKIGLLAEANDLPGPRDNSGKVDQAFPYLRLSDALNNRVCVDAISGTSAGGINAALLDLANARHGTRQPADAAPQTRRTPVKAATTGGRRVQAEHLTGVPRRRHRAGAGLRT
jgi:hypothetical protein